MFRLAYRNFGDHESLVGTFTVNSGGVAGIRWFELRDVTAGPVTVFQESTYQPDTTWRWMGSAAMDFQGNLAIGFSASSSTINPQGSVTQAGRDRLDQHPGAGEAHLLMARAARLVPAIGGATTALYGCSVDDATFWYTNDTIPARPVQAHADQEFQSDSRPHTDTNTDTDTTPQRHSNADPNTNTNTNTTPTPTLTPAPHRHQHQPSTDKAPNNTSTNTNTQHPPHQHHQTPTPTPSPTPTPQHQHQHLRSRQHFDTVS
jgi:hypothetical protein